MIDIGVFLYSIIRISTPLVFCALAALISNHAGAANLAMDAILLTSGLTGVIASALSQNLFIGMLGAMLGGVIVSFILAYMTIDKKANLTLTGISLNNMSSGATILLLFFIIGSKGTSQTFLNSLVFPNIEIPLIGNIPIIGEAISGQNLLTYLAFVLAFICYIFIFKTSAGLRIRAIGFNEAAAASVGINVKRTKYEAFLLSGVLASLGGAFMTMAYLDYWAQDMMGGRGFIGLAATYIANGNVLGAVLAAIFFGATESISITLQTMNYTPELLRMIPYLSTFIGLVIISMIKTKKDASAKK